LERMARMPAARIEGNWAIENDALVLPSVSRFKRLFFGDPSWKDYDLRVKAVVDPNTPREFGLLVRSPDDKQYWAFLIGDFGNMANRDLIPITSLEDGWTSRARRWMSKRQTIQPGQTLMIEVRARDDEITAISDGVELAKSSVGSLKQGRAALWSYGNTRFIDLEVRDPQGRLLWKGLPTLPVEAALRKMLTARRSTAAMPTTQPSAMFWFAYNGEPHLWTQPDATHWEEAYPDGHATSFLIEKRVAAGEEAGLLVRRLPDDGFEVLVPPIEEGRLLRCRAKLGEEWQKLGPIHLIK
jgi:hypothetical protein